MRIIPFKDIMKEGIDIMSEIIISIYKLDIK